MTKSNAFKKPDKSAIADAVQASNPVQTLKVTDPRTMVGLNFKLPLDEVKSFKRAAVEENVSLVDLFRACFKAWQELNRKTY
jgi:hypothetical protein